MAQVHEKKKIETRLAFQRFWGKAPSFRKHFINSGNALYLYRRTRSEAKKKNRILAFHIFWGGEKMKKTRNIKYCMKGTVNTRLYKQRNAWCKDPINVPRDGKIRQKKFI